jgi:glycosyltransferase involved in cell wall biosynthesis
VTDAQTTIVLPVWDDYVAERLPEALQSLERQTPRPAIVVIDNASEVRIPEFPGVSVIRASPRLRLGAARNLGLAEVKTPYVIFWDADDVMLPGTLAHLQDAIASQPDRAAFATAILEEPSWTRHRWPRPWVAKLMRAPRLFALLDCVWSLCPTTGATIIHTELARAAGGFAEADSGEDWCLGVSLAFRGPLGFSERLGRLYRVHHESMWAQHLTARHQLRHARTVRKRIRTDPAVPRWARALLPAIAVGQWSAILAHEGLEAGRRARERRRPA